MRYALLIYPAEPTGPVPEDLIAAETAAYAAFSSHLRERGIWVAAIRPPTVPQGTARLRITLSAAHSEADVALLIGVLHELVH